MNGRVNTIKPHTAINILSRFAPVIYEFNKRSMLNITQIWYQNTAWKWFAKLEIKTIRCPSVGEVILNDMGTIDLLKT